MKRISVLFSAVACCVVACCVFVRCANRAMPQGGPKDSLPPVIKLITPANFQRHFTGKRIFMEFDEYVQLKDQSKEFFTSPPMKYPPKLSIRKRGVRIDITDTLAENQTYALNFGTSVRDNNEGNVLYGLRYVFSTGGAIDSMMMTGYTADAAKGDSVSRTLIFFYDAKRDTMHLRRVFDTIPWRDSLTGAGFSGRDSMVLVPRTDTVPPDKRRDSLLFKERPDALARAENNGIFIAQNLKDIPYRIYAVEDKNGNQTYEPGADKVGFLDSLYNPADPALPGFSIWLDNYRHYPTAEPQVYFRMFGEEPLRRQTMSASERPTRHEAVLRFSAPWPRIDTLRFDSIPDDRIIREYRTSDRDTMSLWFNTLSLPDTVKGRISYMRTDSLGVLQPYGQDLKLIWKFVESREEQREREREEKKKKEAQENGEAYTPPEKPNPFKFKVDAAAEIYPAKSIPIEFTLPLAEIDSTAIILSSRKLGLDGNPMGDPSPAAFRILQDTVNIRKWTIAADWNEDLGYSLTIPAGTFVNIAGERNDSLGANFKIFKRGKFATLNLDVRGKTDDAKYIIQVVNAQGNRVEKEFLDASTGKYVVDYIPEGEMRVRITEDMNGNRKWDTGSLAERRQPERTEFYTGPTGSQIIPARPGWDVDVELDMASIFAPVSIEKIRNELQKAEDARVVKWLEGAEERAAERKKREDAERGGGAGGSGVGIGAAMGGLGGFGGGTFQQSTQTPAF